MRSNTVAFIPARGGSKGLPGKNIKEIAGKPLIAWSIEQALMSALVDDVYVSTDSDDIAKVAIDYGAKAPFRRPASLATDEASTESAMLHFCDYLEKHNNKFDNILLIQATSPIRADNRFDDAIKQFESGGFDSMLSVTPTHHFFWRNPSNPTASYDVMNRPRRQDIKEEDQIYVETGSFYLTRMESLRTYKNRLCGNVGMYVAPEIEKYEIDSLVDFYVCEAILNQATKG